MRRERGDAGEKNHSTITSVPAVMSSMPIADLRVKVSCRSTKARIKVSTVLILSIGTTFEASPSCKAR